MHVRKWHTEIFNSQSLNLLCFSGSWLCSLWFSIPDWLWCSFTVGTHLSATITDTTVKLQLYILRFCALHDFTHLFCVVLAKCPYECKIFTDFMFPQLYVFPKFALNFYRPDHENLPAFTFCSLFLVQMGKILHEAVIHSLAGQIKMKKRSGSSFVQIYEWLGEWQPIIKCWWRNILNKNMTMVKYSAKIHTFWMMNRKSEDLTSVIIFHGK
jgi:hypothetical protein